MTFQPGKLGSAIETFKLMVAANNHHTWSPWWCKFADQAFADLIALEVELKIAKSDKEMLQKKLATLQKKYKIASEMLNKQMKDEP
mgnify:CR=1 FL=1